MGDRLHMVGREGILLSTPQFQRVTPTVRLRPFIQRGEAPLVKYKKQGGMSSYVLVELPLLGAEPSLLLFLLCFEATPGLHRGSRCPIQSTAESTPHLCSNPPCPGSAGFL